MKTKCPLKTLLAVMFLLFTGALNAATFTVTNTNDAGAGSLRQAITSANANPMDADNIVFAIPTSDPNYNAGTGVFTITLASLLPYVTSLSVSIDATTQTATIGNTNLNGPEIRLRSNTNLLFGLCFPLSGGVAKGMIINGFQIGILITKYGTYPSGSCSVSECYLGVNSDGSAADTNGIGVACYGGVASNTINNNLISGNTWAGIGLRNSGSNLVKGNMIGTDRTGMLRIPNYYGVAIDSSAGNTIGGTTPADRNLISGNAYAGIAVNTNVSHDNVIKGNYIGTNINGAVRTDTIANFYGIAINESYNNIIGGTNSSERNIISGNSEAGLAMMGAGVKNTTIYGNYIGTNVSGTDSIPNGNGILLSGASSNAIGGSSAGSGNLISGNRLAGIALAYSGTRNNTIKGNLIGTDHLGTGILSNYTGIYLKSNANSNIIGGSTAAERNIISGNIEMGLCIETCDSNLIKGNYIGPDITGVQAMRLSNDTLVQANGLYFNSNARYNIAGGYNAGEGNVISGNRIYGHDIYGNSSYNSTIGNYIGVDATGNVAMPNATGICVDGGSNHNPFINNVLSGNLAYGMFIVTTGSNYNELKGNKIGTNAAGTDSIPNQAGLLLGGGTKYNIIGGSNAADRNLISGNRFEGILLADTGTMYNDIKGNYIGTNISGTAAIPNEIGIGLATLTTDNNIEMNVISGNTHLGMILYEKCSRNTIYSNKIGVAADGSSPLPNKGAGIVLSKASNHNLIGSATQGNVIAYNDTVGVVLTDTSTLFNRISGNAIYSNGFMDIDLFPYGINPNDAGDVDLGANGLMNYPVINNVFKDWETLETNISGTLDQADPVGTTIELFKTGGTSVTGHGGGIQYLGSVVITDPSGSWSFDCMGLDAGDEVTATATDTAGNTSEFAANASLVVGLKENGAGSALALYPNPATDQLTLELASADQPENSLAGIYNALGSLVWQQSLTEAKTVIDLSDLPAGLYIVKVKTGDQLLIRKVVKK